MRKSGVLSKLQSNEIVSCLKVNFVDIRIISCRLRKFQFILLSMQDRRARPLHQFY